MTDRNALIDIIRKLGHLPVVPLMGFPGARLSKTTLKQNVFNYGLHFRSLMALAERYQPDAIFPMMDLSLEPNALGAPVRYDLMAPPSVDGDLVKNEDDLEALFKVDILQDGRVGAFLETVRLMTRYFNLIRGSYVIGPFTMASQLMGASEAAKAIIKKKELLHKVLAFSSQVISRYAQALAEAGAQIICVLEPSSMVLSPKQFEEFSGDYLNQIYKAFDAIPVLHICGSTDHLIDGMVATGPQGLSLDAAVGLPEIARRVPSEMVLIGNIHPVEVMLQMRPEEVYQDTRMLIETMEPFPNFILSTGCDLPENTPLDNIQAFINAGRGLPFDSTAGPDGVLKQSRPRILEELSHC